MSSAEQQLRYLSDSAGVHLTDDRVLLITGDDARSWLNGQITNDIRELKGDVAAYALVATLKGRVVSDLWALEHGEGMAAVFPAARFDAAFEILDKHVIMEDVELAPAPELRVITVQGPKAEEVAQKAPNVVRRYSAGRLHGHGFDVWLPANQVEAGLLALGQAAKAVGGGLVDEAGWSHAHFALSVPRLGADFGEQSYPQEAGLKTRAVSFSKGCYRGQEVIYMLENRGQLARRLVVLESAQPLAAGVALEAEGKRIGEVTSVDVTPTAAGTTLLMGYVKRPLAEVGQQLSAEGHSCTVRSVVGVTDENCPIIARDAG